MLRTSALLSVALVVLVPLPACLVPPPPTTITLVNETGLDVTPRLFVSASATSADDLFTDGNLVTDFTDRPFPELPPIRGFCGLPCFQHRRRCGPR